MTMLCVLLLLLPLVDARLCGLEAQDSAAPEAAVSCGHSSEEPAALWDGFNGLELLQEDVSASEPGGGGLDVNFLQVGVSSSNGVTKKETVEEWLERRYDKSKISVDQRALHKETVAAKLSKVSSGSCGDDPMWLDADGDGCEIYKYAIESGHLTRESACNGGGVDTPAEGSFDSRLEVFADATAKAFCPVTCGTCQPAPDSLIAGEPGRGGLDDVNFLQVAVSSSNGVTKKETVEEWLERRYDKSKISADQGALHRETVAAKLSKVSSGSCVDDPMWLDADGDGCEIYKYAIESGHLTRESACNGGGVDTPAEGSFDSRLEVFADAAAKAFCPVTCGTCQPAHGSQDDVEQRPI